MIEERGFNDYTDIIKYSYLTTNGRTGMNLSTPLREGIQLICSAVMTFFDAKICKICTKREKISKQFKYSQ